MADDDIYKAWNTFITSDIYKKYFLTNKDDWYQKLEQVKNYIDINHKRPSTTDKIKDIKQLGQWLVNNTSNSKKRDNIMKDDDIYKSWTEFITSDQYIKYFLSDNDVWYQKLELVKQYIDNYKKRPSSHDKSKDIRILGIWLVTQTANSKERKYIMADDDIYKDWTEFITNDIYKKYFKKISTSDASFD